MLIGGGIGGAVGLAGGPISPITWPVGTGIGLYGGWLVGRSYEGAGHLHSDVECVCVEKYGKKRWVAQASSSFTPTKEISGYWQ